MVRLFKKFIFILLVSSVLFVSCVFQSDGRIAIYDPDAPGYIPEDVFARELQIEINKMRGNPRDYALDVITPRLAYYQGFLYTDFEGNSIRTDEGRRAMERCIDYLKNLPPKKKLHMEKGLCKAAQDFTDDHAMYGTTGDTTVNGKNYEDLMDMYGRAEAGVKIASLVRYGRRNAKDIVISILVSDGDYDRKGRKILLGNVSGRDDVFGKVGIGITRGQNAVKGAVLAIYLAESYTSY